MTTHSTAEWTALELVRAFPFDTAPPFIIRDRDGIYGEAVRWAVADIGSEELVIAPVSITPSGVGPLSGWKLV